MYSQKVLDHFTNPRNVGTIPDASTTGLIRSPMDNDTVLISLKIENGIVVDARFKCMGCGAAIACASMATELIKGKTVDEAYQLSKEDVAQALDGIPAYKMTCSNLAPDAVKLAIRNWRDKNL